MAARHGDWPGHEAYLAGPTKVVRETAARLATAGLAQGQIHVEDFG